MKSLILEVSDSGELRYIGWEEYTKKSQELKGIKKIPMWKEDSDGLMKRSMQLAVEPQYL